MEDKLITELNGLIEDVNVNEITAHVADGTFLAWTETWRMKSYMLAGFLNEMLIKARKDEGR